MRSTQLLLSDDFKLKLEHGGEIGRGKRKIKRPFSAKKPLHLTMRSSMAKGRYSFLRKENASFIKELLKTLSAKWAVTVYEFSNNSNHLHLVIRAKDRSGFQGFLRSLAGAIAMKITGSAKGRALANRFWDLPAHTRLLEWGRSFLAAKSYVLQNQLESLGIISYQPRKTDGSGSSPYLVRSKARC